MYLAVIDKTNNLIGYSSEEVDSEKLFFYKKIHEHFDIEPIIDLSIIPYIIRNNKRYIIKIIVNESLVKPLILKYQGMALLHQ